MNRIKIILTLLCLIGLVGCRFAGHGDARIEITDKYTLSKGSAHSTSIFGKKERVVPSEIIEVGWNEEIIIAKQIEHSSSEESDDKSEFYWLIDLTSDTVTGPLNESEFLNIYKELDVSKSFEFKSVKV